ncbi:PAS domain S-box protein [Desulfosarcina sp.]|uniref:PAS domain S-box protein n=1 Tax=Desulfosarcina sp. TaxID=2027861 RepID=UPI0029BD36D0|nr:PAS domain S-box protein [Desulfosarcina sp.]MDX2454367.1 PAS domain S-box protein [Desulfosarcina sp.]MDX2492029.1 PAS domain S-box protein [Desulfosarcina sp.]
MNQLLPFSVPEDGIITDMPEATSKKDTEQHPLQPGRRPGRTLSRDLVVSIVLVVAAVFAMIVSFTYGYMSHKAEVQSAETLKSFSNYLQGSLELSLWNIDEEGIQKICSSFFENALVEKLKVTDQEGTVFFEKQREGIAREAEKKTAIMHGETVVGYLEIALNHQGFRDKQRQFMWFSLITLATVTMVLLVTLRFVLKVFLISPLNQLIQRTEQISQGEYDFVEFQAPQREIRAIASRFNTMADRIRRREKSLRDVNQRLEKEIVEHRDSESALSSSQKELDSIIRSTPDVIYRLDTMGRFTFVSDAIRRYGVTPEELMGRPFMEYIHEDDWEIARYRINERRTGTRSTQRLSIHAFGDYGNREQSDSQAVQRSPVFLVDAEGLYVSGESDVKVFVGTQGIARDITEQRQNESARIESEDRLLLALDVSGAGIWQLDLKMRSFRVDERIYTLMGYSESDLAGGLGFIREKTSPETWEEIELKFNRHVAGRAAMFDHEFKLQSRQGQWKWFHTKAKVVRYDKDGQPETMVGIIIDTSERKEYEAEREHLELKLQQAQKMEAIGTLAGGIAHDFNNILGAILGYSQLTQMHTADNARVQGYVGNIFKASERAKGLVEQILTFTRQGKSQKVPCDIAIVLKEVVKLLRASIPSTIEIVQKIPSNLGTIVADQTQIHQVLMNLCTNAAHAMEARGGKLTVTLENRPVNENTAASGDDLPSGRYLQLSVRDTGSGMDKSVVDRIFDPYYTTKAVGEGTGMGLATVHGIVNDHDGRILVASVPGEGSVFRVLFPVLENPAEMVSSQPASYPRGTERILFVDDEELLVKVGVEMLNDLGYHAVGTTRASQALETFKARPDGFDLIITDMTMPDMTGDQLATQILLLQPGIPIIICTGFSKRISSELVSSLGIRALLMKPVTVQELSRTIRDVLDQPVG